jgi:hypothetical protein
MTKALAIFVSAAATAGCAPSVNQPAATDQLLVPDATGWVDRSATGTTGIQGQWHAFADTRFGAPASDCRTDVFGECSIVHEPAPGSSGAPTAGLGMCTSGVIARWIAGSSGLTPDYSPGWAGLVLELGMPDWPEPRAPASPPAGRPYDAVARLVTGFAFDIDSEPAPGGGLLVTTVRPGESSAGSAPLYWGGAQQDASPVHAGHNEFRWSEVGPGPFDGTRMLRIGFLVAGSDSEAVSYDFCIDNLTALRSSTATSARSASDDQRLVPDTKGWVDRSSTGQTKIQGGWFAVADGIEGGGVPGACQAAGHADADCSLFRDPDPTAATYGPTKDLGMCASGSVAKIVAGADGQPDFSNIWGAEIGFLLNVPSLGGAPQLYDTTRGGVTGFAFDIDAEPPPNAKIAVELTMNATNEGNPPLWGSKGATWSPVHAGHNEFRWEDVGGPWYLPDPPKFDPNLLRQIAFHVLPNQTLAASFSFCINNLTALRH